ncbi:hypothetical protein BB560_003025 [Smittium megazygosporum]|uniref:N-acetyltransferase domain-containing protein n=1 Tax=Smittium megazygosporum TaxID=133381 RepID=A0A2T9ZD99_9FUNG|nr:hypothetical protein BB560_003025 [Smittium megazygosporum]
MKDSKLENVEIIIVQTDQEQKDAFFVRDIVLTKELGFDIASIPDEIDKRAKNVILYSQVESEIGNLERKPLATLRFFTSNDVVKIGRVAVLKEFRGYQAGKKMMQFVENLVWNEPEYSNIKQIALSSIYDKRDFYLKLGYTIKGESYLEEGCPHIYMYKDRPQ